MGWDKRGYYYRVRKVHGRVVRAYIGTGPAAELVARMDEQKREQRRLADLDVRRQKAELAALDAEIMALDTQIELLARAAMVAAGYHRHHRGEWRKRRGDKER